ncbi:MAG: VOC family protein [Cohaesibacteraceae bacterium]|nr:VOC family protein [Cohaesibacteraceae bacterium]
MSYKPDGFHTVTAHMLVNDAKKAIALFEKALDAEVMGIMEMPGTGTVVHASLKIGTSMVFLSDPMPMSSRKPSGPDGSSVAFYLYVENVDAAFDKARNNGMTAVDDQPRDMFWGDRTGELKDPFGHTWTLATKVKDVTAQDIAGALNSFGDS